MSKKMQPVPKGEIVAALDIGTTKVACFIARVIDDYGSVEVIGIGNQAADGIKSGTVVDIDAAETCIRNAVHSAENMAAAHINGYPLRDIIVNVPGSHLESNLFSVDIDVAGHEITANDVDQALARALEYEEPGEQHLIHAIPTSFEVDGHQGVKSPVGLVGDHLRIDMNAVTVRAGAFKNIAVCVERSHLDITSCCASSYASGLSTLVEDEMDLGCTVIDMGGGTTSLSVFHEGRMIYTASVPIGGAHVTNDIARGLSTPLASAERLKTLYGSAIASSTDDNEMIDVPQIGEDNTTSSKHLPRSMLIGIMQPRLEEIFEMVRSELEHSGLGSLISRRVVLTGGAAQVPGIRELSQIVLDKQVRVGKPVHVGGLAEMTSGPAFSTAAGLLLYATQRLDELPDRHSLNGGGRSIFGKFIQWFKENW